MTYEKTVEIPATLLKERVLLDCGKVGVAAEVWVNDVYAGARPWQPFVLEVTEHLRPGPNRFKIRVANTEANARAVGENIDLLEKIDQNGWVGPASLVPFIEREIRCENTLIKGYQKILLRRERLNPSRIPQKEVRTVEVA
jgi:hypothetical protein